MNVTLKHLAIQSLAVLSVAALLLSALGPMMDHHFAERHPGHSHWYLGVADGDHSHPFEHYHIHYDAMYAPAPGDGNVVFFAPYDGMGHAQADVAGPSGTPMPRFDSDGPLLRRNGGAAAVLREVTVAPLRQPPRV